MSLSSEMWMDDIATWPALDLGKIFAFILSKKEFDSDYVGKYKACKGYSYFASGFVGTIFSFSSPQYIVLKCKVIPSQRVRDEAHNVWVGIRKSCSEICVAWCSCNSQSCNHVMALLYKVEHAVTQGYTDPSCTSVPCMWNKQTQREVQPKKIKELKFREDSRADIEKEKPKRELSSTFKQNFDPRRSCDRIVTKQSQDQFLAQWTEINSRSVIFKAFPTPDTPVNAPPSLVEAAAIYSKAHENKEEPEYVADFLESLHFTKEQCQIIERESRGQGDSSYWSEQRKGRITASVFHDVHTKVQRLLARRKRVIKVKPLTARVMGHHPSLEHLPAIQWGRTHEKDAKDAFIKSEFGKHKKLEVQEAGLFVKNDLPYIGASPDAVCYCECCTQFVIEIKCPYSIREKEVANAWNETDFLKMVDGVLSLNPSHKYYTQIQGQMALVGCSHGYFVVWTTKGPPFIQKVMFDCDFWKTILEDLVFFFKGYVVKVLLGIESVTYCSKCRKLCLEPGEFEDSDENSVQCDICEQWHHWGCENFDEENDVDSWVCSSCNNNLA